MEFMVTVRRNCPLCGKLIEFSVGETAYEQYKRGEGYVQELFSQLTDGQREALISGVCEPCFDGLDTPSIVEGYDKSQEEEECK